MNLEDLKTLRDKFATAAQHLNAALEVIEHGLLRENVPPVRVEVSGALQLPPARNNARRGRGPKATAPTRAQRTRANLEGRGALVIELKAIVDSLPEPFTVATAKAAWLEKHPDRAGWTVNIPGALYRWMDAGELDRTAGGGGPGNPASYRRAKSWNAEPAAAARSEKERAYMDFRSTIPTPKTDDE